MAKILVVDDDRLILELFVETLLEEGYEVEGASSLSSALDKIGTTKYDLILSDLKLPDGNGIDVLREAKRKDPNTEVIIISGYGTVDYIFKAVQEGAYDFIVKPTDLNRISVAVKNALMKRRLERELREANQKHRELYEMAIRDGLTELYNQRYFRDLLDREVAKGGKISLVIFDLDRFKDYNDTLGHLKGDRVLVDVARILERNKRSTDIMARYGGDEFVAVLPGTDKINAARFAQRCVAGVERHHFDGEERMKTGQITMSAGVASYPDDASSSEELIEKADQACYQAKEHGRNKVIVYGKDE